VKRTADPSASLPRHAGAGGMTKERVVLRKGLLLKERTVVKGQGVCWGKHMPFPLATAFPTLLCHPECGMGLRPTYDDENVSVSNLSPQYPPPFPTCHPECGGMGLRPTYEHENVSVSNPVPRTHHPFLFVIPPAPACRGSAAEGSAVPRTFPGNVFFDRASHPEGSAGHTQVPSSSSSNRRHL
jgi:hypothetical protein